MDRRHFVVGGAAAAAALATRPAFAQEAYPTRAITFINPFPPGGAADVVGRPMTPLLEPIIKQPCIVDTKAGAAGQVGAQVAANAKPDGYTILIHIVSISGFEQVDKLFGRTPKFTRADFIPIARLTAGPMVLVVNDQTPWKTLKDLVDDAKKRPDEILFSSSGLYGALHLPAALFMKAAGHQDAPSADPGRRPGAHRRARQQCAGAGVVGRGRERADEGRQAQGLATFGAKRAASLPDVPTLQGAWLRRRILALGRRVRAEGHARMPRSTNCAPTSVRSRRAISSRR